MIDRSTKVLLTVIAVNLTVMVGWGAVKVLVSEVRASYDQRVWIDGGTVEVEFPGHLEMVSPYPGLAVVCQNCN